MKLKIHRGTREIGGSCVEAWTDSSRIVVDLGLPLVNPDRSPFDSRPLETQTPGELIRRGILPAIDGLYKSADGPPLVISHAHLDHFGLINYIADGLPVCLGKATHKLIDLSRIFSGRGAEISNPHYFASSEPFLLGDLEITPFLMDHSAFDAYAFLIKNGNQTVFYSGDFRGHGRKLNILERIRTGISRGIDLLLLEGTAIDRGERRFWTEGDLEEQFTEVFQASSGPCLVFASGQNVDRIVSIFRACLKSGRILAVDFYIANILEELSEFARLPHPSREFSEALKVFFPFRLSSRIAYSDKGKVIFRFMDYKISREEIDACPGGFVMLVRPGTQDFLKPLKCLEGGTFIYSLWGGYRKDRRTGGFVDYLISRGMVERVIHTSGHADRGALRKLVEILDPGCIVPIHTFEGDSYGEVFPGRKILRAEDGETISCPVVPGK